MEEGNIPRGTMRTWQRKLLLAEVTKEHISGMKKSEPRQRDRMVVCVWEVMFERGLGSRIEDRIRETDEREIRNPLRSTLRSARNL